eukprot:TRINITY_DN952_c0_g2_i1.p1 TRINITY_DN952_c0_g2~~TRINITY_DN952_c0_g2_i1.p1  ORF type:complete len:566 (-),score=123.06 TRINITY_DN952_c0_g2_i1:214-1911(-)
MSDQNGRQNKSVSEPVSQLMQHMFGDTTSHELASSLHFLQKIMSDGGGGLEQLNEKMVSGSDNNNKQWEVEHIYNPLSLEMQERIAGLETQVKLLKQKKERMVNVLVKMIGRYKLLREDNAGLTSQLLYLKENRAHQGSDESDTITFSNSKEKITNGDSDVPPTPVQSFARDNFSPGNKDMHQLQQQFSFGSNKNDRLLHKLETIAMKQGVPLTPHPSLASLSQPPDNKQHILEDLHQQIQKISQQQNHQSKFVEEQKKMQENLKKQLEEEEEKQKKEDEEKSDEEGKQEEEEVVDIDEEDEDDMELNEKLANLPSVFGNYGSEELQLYEEALTQSRGLIIDLENQLMESKRRELQMIEVRKNLEHILQETEASNVEIEEELLAADQKLQKEKERAESLQEELQQLTSDHAVARKELHQEIKQLKFNLGENLKASLQEGIDLEFEEFVDVAEYVEDEEQDDGKPPNTTSTSSGKKTRVFNKLISYWQTRSTGSLVTRVKSTKINDTLPEQSKLSDTKQSSDESSSRSSFAPPQKEAQSKRLGQDSVQTIQSLPEKIEEAFDGVMQ